MTTPVTLENIIWYGFFTTDLTVTVPGSITTIPANFAYESTNSSGNLGITTNIYLQETTVNGSNINTSINEITDAVNTPYVTSFTVSSSFPSNNNEYIIYNNNVIVNIPTFDYYTSSGSISTYPESAFYININTDNIDLTQYINKYKNIEFPDTIFTVGAIQNYVGFSTDKIQINIGLGNIEVGYVNNTNILYNPYLPNLYNNYKSYGNNNSCGWIIFSTNF